MSGSTGPTFLDGNPVTYLDGSSPTYLGAETGDAATFLDGSPVTFLDGEATTYLGGEVSEPPGPGIVIGPSEATIRVTSIPSTRILVPTVPGSGGPTPTEPLPPSPVEEPQPESPPTGSETDIEGRIAALLPPWFGAGQPGSLSPILRIPVAMAAAVGSWLWGLVDQARRQTRFATATGVWLDLWAWDFLGMRLRRRRGQSDESFRRRVRPEVLRPRVTRLAMAAMLRDLTGREPRILEPSRPADTGAYGIPSGLAYGVSGAYGTVDAPGEVFIDVYRAPDAGIPYASGYGMPAGGYGVPSRLVYANLGEISGALTDADVYAAVNAMRPAGIRAWVRLN